MIPYHRLPEGKPLSSNGAGRRATGQAKTLENDFGEIIIVWQKEIEEILKEIKI